MFSEPPRTAPADRAGEMRSGKDDELASQALYLNADNDDRTHNFTISAT